MYVHTIPAGQYEGTERVRIDSLPLCAGLAPDMLDTTHSSPGRKVLHISGNTAYTYMYIYKTITITYNTHVCNLINGT